VNLRQWVISNVDEEEAGAREGRGWV